MLHTFSGGGERRERGGQNRKGAKHAGEALCWATVPPRETTVEKLEMRRRGEEGRGWEVGEGVGEVGGGAEVRRKEHQVSAAISFAGGAAPPSVKVRAAELQMFQDDVRL